MTLHPIDCMHDGLHLEGQLALPDAPGPHPGVLVMANAYGIGEKTRKQAEILASHGYAALATDMYGGGIRCTIQQQTGEHVNNMAGRIMSAIDAYASDPKAHANNVTQLVGSPAKRLRVGDFRAIFDETDATITITKVAPRGNSY